MLLTFNISFSYSKTINYICKLSDGEFIRFYKINTDLKTILYDKAKVGEKDVAVNKGQIFSIKRYDKILDWDYPNIWTYQKDNYSLSKNYNFLHFDFKNNRLTIMFMNDQTIQKYNCF